MKTAIYIEDGKRQIVLTPETELEKHIIKEMSSGKFDTTFYTGSFYDCQGGWVRHNNNQDSLMIVMK